MVVEQKIHGVHIWTYFCLAIDPYVILSVNQRAGILLMPAQHVTVLDTLEYSFLNNNTSTFTVVAE